MTDPVTDSFVQVDDEPLHHERWRSNSVRLVDVQFPPQTTCLWHQHLHYGVYICITPIHATERAKGDVEAKQLYKHRGEVFCRDHVQDHLVHRVSTSDEAMRIIEVELLQDNHRLPPQLPHPVHKHHTVQMIHDDSRCRVYRITLHKTKEAASLSVVLASEAVLVALTTCAVTISNPAQEDAIQDNDTHTMDASKLELQPGDDVLLHAGRFTVKLDQSETAEFILTEVY